MAQEIFAGRRNFKRDFSRYLAIMAAEGKDQRPFFPFHKQTDTDELWPRIFMFYGVSGTGKSAMVDQCLDCARSMGSETKKNIKVLLLDGEDISLRNTITPQTFIEALYSVFIDEDSAIAPYFSEYGQIKQRIEHVRDTAQRLMIDEWYHEKLEHLGHSQKTKKQEMTPGAVDHAHHELTADFIAWLHENKSLPEDDLDLYDNSDYRLSMVLVNGIVRLSADYAVVLAIDAFDRVSSKEMESWMRTVFLAKLFEKKSRVMVIISGRENLTRNYRNSFQEEMLCSINFNDFLLTRSDINECAKACQLNLGIAEIDGIEENSRGIPLVVRDILGLAKSDAPLADVLKETQQADASLEQLVYAEASRFLKQCPDNAVKKKVLQCALMYQLEGNALAKLWNVPYADVSTILTDLSEQYPFISCKRMHETGHSLLRDLLIKEAVAGENTEIASIVKEFGTAAAQLFSEQLDELKAGIGLMEKRYDDQRYQTAVLAYCNSLAWDNAGKLFKVLPGIVIECLQYNRSFAIRLLRRIDEFREMFTKNQCKNIDIMKNGVLAYNPQGLWLMAPPREEETSLLKFLEDKSADCGEQQLALLYCRKGESYFRSAHYDRACEEFERCIPFIEGCASFGKTVIDSLSAVGALFFFNQKFDAAVHVYKLVVQRRPNDHDAWYALGQAQTESGEHAEAAPSYAKTVELKPDWRDAWRKLGREYYAMESFDPAIQAFEKALPGDKPDDAADWHAIGKSRRALEQNEKAVEAFKKAVGLEPENKDFWYDCATAHAAVGQDDDAIAAFEKTVQIDPGFHKAWLALGNQHFQSGRHEASIEAYAKVLEAIPDDKDALYKIALAHYARGAYVEAIAYLGKFIDHDPANEDALYTMALAHHGCGQYGDAIQFYKKAADVRPGNIDALHNMGRAYRAQGLYQDAVEIYRKALALDPEKPELWDDLGVVFNAMSLWGDAIQCFKNLVKLDANWAQAWYHLGLTYYHVRHFEDALKSYMTAVEVDPSHYLAWGSIGSTQYSLGNFDKVIEASSKALSIKPDEPWIMCNCALAYVNLEKFDQAAIEYEKIISYARSKEDLLQPISALTAVLEENPGFAGARYILQKLKDAVKQK